MFEVQVTKSNRSLLRLAENQIHPMEEATETLKYLLEYFQKRLPEEDQNAFFIDLFALKTTHDDQLELERNASKQEFDLSFSSTSSPSCSSSPSISSSQSFSSDSDCSSYYSHQRYFGDYVEEREISNVNLSLLRLKEDNTHPIEDALSSVRMISNTYSKLFQKKHNQFLFSKEMRRLEDIYLSQVEIEIRAIIEIVKEQKASSARSNALKKKQQQRQQKSRPSSRSSSPPPQPISSLANHPNYYLDEEELSQMPMLSTPPSKMASRERRASQQEEQLISSLANHPNYLNEVDLSQMPMLSTPPRKMAKRVQKAQPQPIKPTTSSSKMINKPTNKPLAIKKKKASPTPQQQQFNPPQAIQDIFMSGPGEKTNKHGLRYRLNY